VEKNNEDKKLLKPEWFEVRGIEKGEVLIEKVDVLEKIRGSKMRDNEVVEAVEEMKKAEVKVLRDEE